MKLVFLLLTAMVSAQDIAPTSHFATIHVYRAKAKIKGVALHPSIYYDGRELYRLYVGTFVTTQVSVGKHMISVGRSEVGLLMDLEAGQDYYFCFGHKNMLVTGFSGAQPITLTLVSKDEAKSAMVGLRDAVLHPKKCNSCGDRQ
jgi:hypothetical protein